MQKSRLWETTKIRMQIKSYCLRAIKSVRNAVDLWLAKFSGYFDAPYFSVQRLRGQLLTLMQTHTNTNTTEHSLYHQLMPMWISSMFGYYRLLIESNVLFVELLMTFRDFQGHLSCSVFKTRPYCCFCNHNCLLHYRLLSAKSVTCWLRLRHLAVAITEGVRVSHPIGINFYTIRNVIRVCAMVKFVVVDLSHSLLWGCSLSLALLLSCHPLFHPIQFCKVATWNPAKSPGNAVTLQLCCILSFSGLETANPAVLAPNGFSIEKKSKLCWGIGFGICII